MFRIILQTLLPHLVLAGDPSDLSSYKTTIFLPYASKFSANETPTIKGKIKGKEYTIPIDTGSTGVMIGAPKLPSIPKSSGTPGTEYLTSSNLLFTGRFVNISLTFLGDKDTKARSEVPVLVVDKAVKCPGYNVTGGGSTCPDKRAKNEDTGTILYMGVGFGRNTEGSGLPYAIPSHNPFLNIKAVNGKKVTDKTFRNGYTVSTKGIYLGLTPKNTKEYVWTSLDKGTTPDPRDWAMVRTSFKVNNEGPYEGAALIDTGIPQMYIQTSPAGNLPNETIPNTYHPPSKITVVTKGTHLEFGFPVLGEEGVAGYDFAVGDKKFKSQPAWVVPVTSGTGPHVNTGRKFLYGFNVAFDAVGGRFGFKCLRCA